jgi:hypothetical protein
LAQETRSTIYGQVTDPQNAAIAGVPITITNIDTNVSTQARTNQTGYYEAALLLPGRYEVHAQAPGFKAFSRRGLQLAMSSRLQIDIGLAVGSATESVTVTAAGPLVDATAVSSGRVVDEISREGLVMASNNVMLLARLAPGVQTSGAIRTTIGPTDRGSDSDYVVSGGVGGNEFAFDGASNNMGRSVAFVPHMDAVSEMKVETSGFDASVGHTSGVLVTVVSKSGSNQLHGTLSDLNWQTRWRALTLFARQSFYRSIAEAEARGDHARAEEIRNGPKQQAGVYNHAAATIGGPVVIPRVYDGRNKLFFFFNLSGFRAKQTAGAQYLNNTFPTMSNRDGDFSQLLQVNASRYQIYDPLTVRSDPARPGHYIRTPLAGNIVPASRIINPAYQSYLKFLPTPNNDPLDPRQEPVNNFLGVSVPQWSRYNQMGSRIDYNHSARHRFFLRWTWDDYLQNNFLDWAYETYPGLMNNGSASGTKSAVADWTVTATSNLVLDFFASVTEPYSGSKRATPLQFKPSDVGLPAYLDARAGDRTMLPYMDVSGYNSMSFSSYPTVTRYLTKAAKTDIMYVRGMHSIRAGVDVRDHFLSGSATGATSGSFSFSNTYTQRNDDGFTPAASIGHSWAAFMMGLPASASISTADSYIVSTPYYGAYVQDTWRVTRKLNLNLGLRMEYLMGPRERYNRMLAYFDPAASLPITSAAQAAYAQKPVPELAESSFRVSGGNVYPGLNGVSTRVWDNQMSWMPRIGAAYEIDSRTVIRGGYGMFFDALTASVYSVNQSGYSRSTSTVLTNDFGQTWRTGNPGAGVSPMQDPFPVRSDGTRFDEPIKASLGSMTVAGGSFTFNAPNTKPARQHRWRASVQRQVGASLLVEAAYAGSTSDRVYITSNSNPLPEQYWATGQTRNNAVATNLNANVTNPFQLANFSSLATSSPAIYQNMSTLSYFTSSTIRKNQLLRPYPQMSSLSQSNSPLGKSKTHELNISLERRFSKGFNLQASYTRLHNDAADYFANEFDPTPTWEASNQGRPHRLTGASVVHLPFGKGRAFAKQGLLNWIFGGFQIGLVYEFQSGPLLTFGNLFFNGDPNTISTANRSFSQWFDTSGFERDSTKQPAAYHVRVFPRELSHLRADITNNWNTNLQREFKIKERASLRLRLDVMNLQNRAQMAAPELSPTSTNFGVITSQTQTTPRAIMMEARVAF